jgi:hypothetical protein
MIANLDDDEQLALERAMLEHFGPCTCQAGHAVSATGVLVQLCARHRFLEEQDRGVSRLQRLVFVRRTRAYWRRQEFGAAPGDGLSMAG